LPWVGDGSGGGDELSEWIVEVGVGAGSGGVDDVDNGAESVFEVVVAVGAVAGAFADDVPAGVAGVVGIDAGGSFGSMKLVQGGVRWSV
jgi:hypothetical protein